MAIRKGNTELIVPCYRTVVVVGLGRAKAKTKASSRQTRRMPHRMLLGKNGRSLTVACGSVTRRSSFLLFVFSSFAPPTLSQGRVHHNVTAPVRVAKLPPLVAIGLFVAKLAVDLVLAKLVGGFSRARVAKHAVGLGNETPQSAGMSFAAAGLQVCSSFSAFQLDP